MNKLSVKKGIFIVSALLLTGTATMTAYAFLGSKPEEKINTIRVGEQAETIQETFDEPTVQNTTDIVQKIVNVKNTGSVPCFARVYLDFSDSSVQNQAEIIYTKDNIKQTKKWTEFLNDLPDSWTYISETDETNGTTLGGYFYYTQILNPNSTTASLIDAIKTNFQNVNDISDFEIIVYSETVQTVEINTSGTVYQDTDYLNAWKSFLHIS